MRKTILAIMIVLLLILSGCTGYTLYKERNAGTGTIIVKTLPDGLDVVIESSGNVVASGVSPLVFDQAKINKNYVITGIDEDGFEITETRSITKTGGSVVATLNFNKG